MKNKIYWHLLPFANNINTEQNHKTLNRKSSNNKIFGNNH